MKKQKFFSVLQLFLIFCLLGGVAFAAKKRPAPTAPVSEDDVPYDQEKDLAEIASADYYYPDDDISFDEEPNAIDELMAKLIRAGGKLFDSERYGLQGVYVIVKRISGIIEEGRIDEIKLVALRKSDGIYDRKLLFEVTPPDGEPYLIELPDYVKGYESKIELNNFIATGKSEVILSLQTGALRGSRRFFIIDLSGRKANIIYDSQATHVPAFQGKFFDNYRAEIFVEESDVRVLIDLSPRKNYYLRKRVYNSGTDSLRSNIKVWANEQSSFKPLDLDRDGINELKGVIDLYGAGNNDRIAYMDFTIKYAGGRWNVVDAWIAPAEDLNAKPLPRYIDGQKRGVDVLSPDL